MKKMTQRNSTDPKDPPLQLTEPEVFILETLTFENEQAGLFEGRVLADILKMCGKKPRYYYFRTEEELIALSQMFRASGYRYLHLSCHGDPTHIFTTLGTIPIARFAKIFRGKLKNRRLFVSACEVGSEIAVAAIAGQNKGMYSVASPVDKIRFDHATALWSAFYVRVFDVKFTAMKGLEISQTLACLCRLFGIRFFWSRYNAKIDKWVHKTLQ